MPRTKTTQPAQSRQKGQRSLDLPAYFNRYLPPYRNPEWLEGNVWREVVKRQPIAVNCRDTMIEYYTALDWKVEPRDSEKRDEYKKEIEYYENFFEYTGEYDYIDLVSWLGRDLLDLPFGAGMEVGRANDAAAGKVLWIEPLDGATLFPTDNFDFPVGQSIRENKMESVYFPAHAINRMYMFPDTRIKLKGWGCPPPMNVYLSLELINRGDLYYANLLLDTPSAGILDLRDMSKDSAEAWLQSWRDLLSGIDPYKVPVLYEHDQPAVFIPFTKNPTELMFDSTVSRYAALVAAGYGMTLSDIGFPTLGSGGETLAGSIRQERKTRKTGLGYFKGKFTYFFNRLLPKYLKFVLIDLDDEFSMSVGRARLANATAMQILVDKKIALPNEARQQFIADGLFSISMPETVEGGDTFEQPMMNQPFGGGNPKDPKSQERPGLLGRPISPSQGGWGESHTRSTSNSVNTLLDVIYNNPEVFFDGSIGSVDAPLIADEYGLEGSNKEKFIAAFGDYIDDLRSFGPQVSESIIRSYTDAMGYEGELDKSLLLSDNSAREYIQSELSEYLTDIGKEIDESVETLKGD